MHVIEKFNTSVNDRDGARNEISPLKKNALQTVSCFSNFFSSCDFFFSRPRVVGVGLAGNQSRVSKGCKYVLQLGPGGQPSLSNSFPLFITSVRKHCYSRCPLGASGLVPEGFKLLVWFLWAFRCASDWLW